MLWNWINLKLGIQFYDPLKDKSQKFNLEAIHIEKLQIEGIWNLNVTAEISKIDGLEVLNDQMNGIFILSPFKRLKLQANQKLKIFKTISNFNFKAPGNENRLYLTIRSVNQKNKKFQIKMLKNEQLY